MSETSYLGMSDEEISNMEYPSEETNETVESNETVDNQEEAEESNPEEVESEEITEELTEDAKQSEEESEETEDNNEQSDQSEEESSNEDQTEDSKPDEEDTSQETENSIDYKSEYEKILKPFKANGKEIQVDNVEDAISLMKMGANYTKKMMALKPNLKIVKALEKNDLLDEDKINFLIDVSKNNPDAIKKLIKDSGVDLMELDTEEASSYQPNDYSVSDKEMDLNQVLDEIQDSPTYDKTINLVSKQWDRGSKQVIAENPQILKVINDHMSSGVYDVISKRLEKERLLGKLAGLSDIDAYRQIGDAIDAEGGFNHLFDTKPEPESKIVKPVRKSDQNLKSKKKAASTTKGSKTTKSEINYLELSDEEFEKMAQLNF